MIINLIDAWLNKKPSPPQSPFSYSQQTSDAAKRFDETTTQSSFQFTKGSPDVIFVKDCKFLEPIDYYDDLPGIALTDEEEQARQTKVAELSLNPRFYDGLQMIITDAVYDDDTNTVYLQAKKVPYSFIVSLSQKLFPQDSLLYKQTYFKTGVLTALLSNDDHTILLQRRTHGLFSVPGGFLEPQGEDKKLNFAHSDNLVQQTAKTELKEEFAGIAGSDATRFEYEAPQLTAVSLRQSNGNPIATLEFVASVQCHCHSSTLKAVASNNMAKDAYEHNALSQLIPLSSYARNDLLTLLTNGYAGAALYLPVILANAALANPHGQPFPRVVPNSTTQAIPLSFFNPGIAKPLLLSHSEQNNEQAEQPAIACSSTN